MILFSTFSVKLLCLAYLKIISANKVSISIEIFQLTQYSTVFGQAVNTVYHSVVFSFNGDDRPFEKEGTEGEMLKC